MRPTKRLPSILRRAGLIGAMVLALVVLSGCTMTMRQQPRVDPYRPAPFFGNERSALPPVEDTVPYGEARLDAFLYTGQVDGQYVEAFPFEITQEDLEYGRQRYEIYCAPCHGFTGNGDGMIVQRGFRAPQSFNQDRLREAAPGYFFYAITNGFGAMPSYANRIPVRDRWLIIAYIKALQLSQHAPVEQLPPEDVAKLEATQ
ncbi:MAG TPA: cytochrome c [Anaerolineae bacterium]|nr:cytochrome c [Anaerolineae bacterium]